MGNGWAELESSSLVNASLISLDLGLKLDTVYKISQLFERGALKIWTCHASWFNNVSRHYNFFLSYTNLLSIFFLLVLVYKLLVHFFTSHWSMLLYIPSLDLQLCMPFHHLATRLHTVYIHSLHIFSLSNFASYHLYLLVAHLYNDLVTRVPT